MLRQNSRTDDGALASGSRPIHGFTLAPDGTNAAVAIFYDNDSAASGTVLMELHAPATQSVSVMLPAPIKATDGVYVDVTTSGACRAGIVFG